MKTLAWQIHPQIEQPHRRPCRLQANCDEKVNVGSAWKFHITIAIEYNETSRRTDIFHTVLSVLSVPHLWE